MPPTTPTVALRAIDRRIAALQLTRQADDLAALARWLAADAPEPAQRCADYAAGLRHLAAGLGTSSTTEDACPRFRDSATA
jgi:hypothetical protein